LVLILVIAWLVASCSGTAQTPEPATGSSPTRASNTSRTVVLEVSGQGTTDIYYAADTNGSESNVMLPWSKTVVVELSGAERTSGRLVSIVPGSVRAADGRYVVGQCRIVVDGNEVANNRNGQSRCEHLLK